MKKFAVIVAGGSGKRMGSDIPKQFLMLNGKPLLYYTIRTFLKAFSDIQIILVLPQDYIDRGKEIVDAWFYEANIIITVGGETRFDSVKNGLSLVTEESIVFVHDAVRCLVTENLIHLCYDKAIESGNAIPCISSKDSVRILNNESNEVIDRNKIKLIQTPQTFHSKLLIPAFNIDYKERFTDEATVVEAFGVKINLVDGDEENIKVTHPSDLVLAEYILKMRIE